MGVANIFRKLFLSVIVTAVTMTHAAFAQSVSDRSLGEGPFDRLVIRGATLIDGAGSAAIAAITGTNKPYSARPPVKTATFLSVMGASLPSV